MLADGASRHLFYRIVKGDRLYGPDVLEYQLMDVIADLQDKYSGRVWVSRSPEGIVIDRVIPAKTHD
jgi:hypothetical protein